VLREFSTTWGPSRSAADLLAYDSVLIFGASPAAREVERWLSAHGKTVYGYLDNAVAKHGTAYNGRPVIAPADIRAHLSETRAIIIAAAYQVEIGAQLIDDLEVPEAQVFPYLSTMFAGHFGRAALEPAFPALESLMERVADAASRTYLCDLVRFRWTMNPLDLRRNPNLAGFYDYAVEGLSPRAGDHVVDCGAYIGDTAKVFLERMNGQGRVSAIEPLSLNIAAMHRWIAESNAVGRVLPVEAAVGEAPGEARIAHDTLETDPRAMLGKTGIDAGGDIVRVETLDRLFPEDSDRVDYLKIDIEGFEPEALRGARALLVRDKPRLALAGYHKPEHLWQLPALLDQLLPGYEIYLGHHPAAPYECEFFCLHPERPAKAA